MDDSSQTEETRSGSTEETLGALAASTISHADIYQQKRKLSSDDANENGESDMKKGKPISFEDNSKDVLSTDFEYDRTREENIQKVNLDIFNEANMPPLFNHLNHIENICNTDINLQSSASINADLIMNISDNIRGLDDNCMDFDIGKPEPAPTVPNSADKPLNDTVNEAEENQIDENKTDENKADDQAEEKRKISNVRKNIRDVFDDNQLDSNTLTAQRLELERLNRVQEQQRNMRETQRQNRVLSLLQGNHSLLLKSSSEVKSSIICQSKSEIISDDENDKIKSDNLDGNSSTASVVPQSRSSKLEESSILISEDSGDDEKEPLKEVVTIIDSSDDDCILLSDVEDEDEDAEDGDAHNSGLHVNDKYNTPDELGRVVINIGHPENEEDIYLAPQIARNIKPHQIGGVRFLYDNIIESLDRFNSSDGFGCILAHSMGLGKTLQLCCFCDIFLRHTNSKSVLCIMPINTLQNWVAEFNMWLPDYPPKSPLYVQGEVRPRNFNVYVLNDTHKTLHARSKLILEWASTGGVLLMGYELFRLLSSKKLKRRKTMRNVKREERKLEEEKSLLDQIFTALVNPGPDLIVCDEGHRIKNSHASISVALKQIRSKRRIVLTGYPLQNNLLEYWCMVDFVRPNYLGSRTEFCNMFERPIQNGQCVDSTPQDIKLMRFRAHVLHSLLLGFVQRRSHIVLQSTLPQKEEYVLLIRLTEFQRKLYDVFMNDVVRTKAVPNPLKAFAVCCKIWNHPDVLFNYLKKREFDLDLEETYNNISIDEVKAIAANLSIDNTEQNAPDKDISCQAGNEDKPYTLQSKMQSQLDENADRRATCSDTTNMYSKDTQFLSRSDSNYGLQSNSSHMTSRNDGQVPSLSLHNDEQPFGQQENPDILLNNANRISNNAPSSLENSMKDGIAEDKTANASAICATSINNTDMKETKATRDDSIPYDWAVNAMKDYIANVIENSPKMEIFFCVLEECILLGDRLLVFSQSLLTLNLIEQFLRMRPANISNHLINWRKNENYFREYPIFAYS